MPAKINHEEKIKKVGKGDQTGIKSPIVASET